MRKIFAKLILPLVIFGGVLGLSLVPAINAAADVQTMQEYAETVRCDWCPENLFGEDGVFKRITNVVLYIVGVVAIIMLIIGGIKYVVSGGDAKKVTDAKNTVLYAVIGLIIALLAFAIVNFVITALPSA